MEMLVTRLEAKLKELRIRYSARKPIETNRLKEFLAEHEEFLAHTNKEIVPNDQVIVGYFEQSEDVPNVPNVVGGSDQPLTPPDWADKSPNKRFRIGEVSAAI